MTLRRWLRKLYPLHWLNRTSTIALERCQYLWLARHHGIDFYPETPLARLSKDMCAVDLLRRLQVEHPWIPASLFPGAGSADHKLLYVLGRALAEFRFRSILELGAGETTKILDAFARQTGHRVTTLEHDADWVQRVRNRGLADTHMLLHCPLVTYEDKLAGLYRWYDLTKVSSALNDRFDLFVVDGPVGTRYFSRFGFARFFPTRRGDDWLLLWDDLDRVGDLQSFAALVDELRSARSEFGHRLIVSGRTLGAVFTPAFEAVRYYL